MKPLVSVCIPTYNGEQYLRDCLDSALAQTYKNIEIVIVDDRSNDGTISIISEYKLKEDRIRLYINEHNLGLVGNWNKCLSYVEGEWIKFLFQDDYIKENAIEEMMQFASPDNKFIVCNRNFIFENDVPDEIQKLYTSHIDLSVIFNVKQPQLIPAEVICESIVQWIYKNYIGEPTSVLFHKSILNQIGYFNDLLAQLCDVEYWFRVASYYGLFFIPEKLVDFRIHNEAMSNVNRRHNRDAMDTIIILYELSFGKSFERFRNNINYFQVLRLRQLLTYRIVILKRKMRKNRDERAELYYLKIAEQIPYLKSIKNSSINYYAMMLFIWLRSNILKIFRLNAQ